LKDKIKTKGVKKILSVGLAAVFLFSAGFLTSCNDTGAAQGFYLEPAELSRDAGDLMDILNKKKEWVYRYEAQEELEISLMVSYYENGVTPISHVPTYQGKIMGNGLLVIDYDQGDLLMGTSSEDGHQSIRTTTVNPEAQGSITHSLDHRIELEPGSYTIGSIVMSKDGSIESRGISDEDAIRRDIEANDYVLVVTLEVHP